MAFNAGTITIALGVTTSGMNKAIRDTQRLQRSVQASATAINASNAKTAASFAAMTEAALAFGRVMTTFVTFPLLVLGGVSTRVFSEFEFNIAKVTGLVGIAAEQTSQWGEEIKRLSSKVGEGPGELAESLYLVTTGGIRGAETMKVLELAAKASAAGMGETKEVVDILVSAMNAYGKENLSAAQAADILTATVREGKAEADKLVQSMGVVLPIASKMGVSFAETGAAMAAMTRTGTKATTAAQQLRQILNKIVRPAQHTEKALHAMGTSAAQLREEIKDKGLLTTLIDLNKLTKKYGDTAISEVFPRIRALTGVLDLVGENMAENVKLTEAIINAQGDLNRAFDIASNTWRFKFNQAVAEGKVLLAEWGEAVVSTLLPAIENLINKLSDWGDAFRALNQRQQELIIKIAGFAAAIGPLIIILNVLINSVITPLLVYLKLLWKALKSAAFAAQYFALVIGSVATAAILVVAAIGLVVLGVVLYTKKSIELRKELEAQEAITKGLTKAQQQASRSVIEEKRHLEGLTNILKSSNSTEEQRKTALEKLHGVSQNYFGDLQDEADGLDLIIERTEDYIGSLKRRAEARALEIGLIELEKDRINALISGEQMALSTWQKFQATWRGFVKSGFTNNPVSVMMEQVIMGVENAEVATHVYDATLKAFQDRLNAVANNVDDLNYSFNGLSRTLAEGLPEDKSALKETVDRIKTQIAAEGRYLEYHINANNDIYKDNAKLQTLLGALETTKNKEARKAIQNQIIIEKSAMNTSFAAQIANYKARITALSAHLKQYNDEISRVGSPRVLANLELDTDLTGYNDAMKGLAQQNEFFGQSFDIIGEQAKLQEKTLKKVSTNIASIIGHEVQVQADGSEVIVAVLDKRVQALLDTYNATLGLISAQETATEADKVAAEAAQKLVDAEAERVANLAQLKGAFMAAGVEFDVYGRQANKTAEDILTLDVTLKDLEKTLDKLRKNRHLFDEDDIAKFEELQALFSQELFVAQTNDMQSDMDQLIQKQKDLGTEYNLNNEKLSLMRSHLRGLLNTNTEGWDESQIEVWKDQVALAKDNVEILEAKLLDVNQILNGISGTFTTFGEIVGGSFEEFADKVANLINLLQSLAQIADFVNTIILATKVITTGAAIATTGETAALTSSTIAKAANTKASTAHAAVLVGEQIAIHGVSAAAAGGAVAGATLAGTAMGFPALLAAIPAGVATVMTALSTIPAAAALTALAKGGEIPPGYPNDNFPARLTSGEMVIPKDKVPAGASFEQVLAMLNETNNISNSQSTSAANTTQNQSIANAAITTRQTFNDSITNKQNTDNSESVENNTKRMGAISNAVMDIQEGITNHAFHYKTRTDIKNSNNLLKKEKEVAHMAKGGKVPPGYSNDNFPAMLKSGEIVIPDNQVPTGASFETVLSMLNDNTNVNNRNNTRNDSSIVNSTNTKDVINNAVKTRQTAFDAVTNIQNKTTNSNSINRTNEKVFQSNRQVNNQYDEIAGSIQYTEKIKNIPKLASGGIVPPGYPNDSYPAMLTTGERITPPQALPEFDGLKGLFGEVKFEIEGEVITGILEIMNSKSQAF